MWKTALPAGVILGILLLVPLQGIYAADSPPAESGAKTYTIQNPLGPGNDNFETLVLNVSDALRDIALFFAVIAIIFVGFKFVSASVAGNDSELTQAKKMLTWVLIGTAVVVGASVIAHAVVNTIKGLS